MFLENYRKFILYYGKNRRMKLAGFTIMSFVAGLLEFLGIALIYPFIMLIVQPNVINLSKYINLENNITTGLLIGLSVLVIFIIKNAFIILNLFLQSKFVANWKQDILHNIMKFYLFAPYKTTMQISPQDKLYTMTTLVNTVVDNFVMRILNLVTNIIIILMILLLLVIKFPIPAIITACFASITIVFQNKFFKLKTTEIANKMNKKYKTFQDALLVNINNIKEIKILCSEEIFIKKFMTSFEELKDIQISHIFYCTIPPYIVEILVVIALIIMAFILSIQNINNNSTLIASFAVVVAALFRIAPALNRIQSSIIAINTSREFVKQINNEYEKYNYHYLSETKNNNMPIKFEKSIELKNIQFSYRENEKTLNNINLEINKGDFIGLIGLSGAGKSTLADVILGLLPVDSGEIRIDGSLLNINNYSSFRKLIGYVPQRINLLDLSIAENIAFGKANINKEQILSVLKQVQLYDFVNELPNGIDSRVIIGSQGLSEGQMQRIAIARALYNNPEIIILDEATSALDVQTEKDITNMLCQYCPDKTIIAIAHRLSTLKACNKIVYMSEGKIVDVGTFEELSSKYADFERLIKLSNIN